MLSGPHFCTWSQTALQALGVSAMLSVDLRSCRGHFTNEVPTEMPLVEDKQVFALCFEAGEGEDAVLWGAREVVLSQVHPFGGLTFQGHGEIETPNYACLVCLLKFVFPV